MKFLSIKGMSLEYVMARNKVAGTNSKIFQGETVVWTFYFYLCQCKKTPMGINLGVSNKSQASLWIRVCLNKMELNYML